MNLNHCHAKQPLKNLVNDIEALTKSWFQGLQTKNASLPSQTDENNHYLSRLEAMIRELQHRVGELADNHHISLCPHEFAFFCDLIICVAEMSQYLTSHRSSRWVRQQALYGLELVKRFESFLQRNQEYYSRLTKIVKRKDETQQFPP